MKEKGKSSENYPKKSDWTDNDKIKEKNSEYSGGNRKDSFENETKHKKDSWGYQEHETENKEIHSRKDPHREVEDQSCLEREQPTTKRIDNHTDPETFDDIIRKNSEAEAYTDQTGSHSTKDRAIRRVWVWAGGSVPRSAIEDGSSNWWEAKFNLGMTDYVISLNDHGFTNGLGIKNNYFDSSNRSNVWQPICEILRIISSHNIAPHLMIFLKPEREMICEAAEALNEIVNKSSVIPRSIQLDLEGWWTRRSASDRQAGEQAIQTFFIDRWNGAHPEIGIGVTCIGSVPQAIRGVLNSASFVIPQMYASERNYGRPLRTELIETHYNRAIKALGREGRVIVGQTSNDDYVNSQTMKEMLQILLELEPHNGSGVSEIAYWSDRHFLNSRSNRRFLLKLTNLVKNEGLHMGNIDQL